MSWQTCGHDTFPRFLILPSHPSQTSQPDSPPRDAVTLVTDKSGDHQADQTDHTENGYGQSHRDPERHGWSFAAALAQAVVVEGCPHCGDPLDGPALTSQCRQRHTVSAT